MTSPFDLASLGIIFMIGAAGFYLKSLLERDSLDRYGDGPGSPARGLAGLVRTYRFFAFVAGSSAIVLFIWATVLFITGTGID